MTLQDSELFQKPSVWLPWKEIISPFLLMSLFPVLSVLMFLTVPLMPDNNTDISLLLFLLDQTDLGKNQSGAYYQQ